MQTTTDAQLLDAYSSRQDEAAFGELMRRHGKLVYRTCHRLLKDSHEAEDASQAVFVVLARKAGRLRKGDLSAWLYRVAHHVAAETVRKRMRRAAREEVHAVNQTIQVGESRAADAADPAVLGLVDTALLNLPERYREAVVLRYLKNHSVEDAARLANCSNADIETPHPEGLEYLPFQKAGIAYALKRTATWEADEMGLGKTVEAIGFINAKRGEIRNVLIVCPASVKMNWKAELERWLVLPEGKPAIHVVNGRATTNS